MTATLTTPPAVFNHTAVEHWLTTLHGRSTGHVWIGSTLDFKGRTFDTGASNWTDQATNYITRLDHADADGIYLRTTTLHRRPDEGRGGDDDSRAIPGLAADLDIAGPGHKNVPCAGGTACTHHTDTGSRKHAKRVLPLLPDTATAKHLIDETGLLAPSIWIHSGGGLYPWWLLDQPHTITSPAGLNWVKTLAARWQEVIGATAQQLGWNYGHVGDLARILRIPGTVNRKQAMPTPQPCRIVHDSGRRYSLLNLRDNLREAYAALPAPPLPPRRPAATTTSTGGLTPGLDFEQRVDWADILTRHGWTFAYNHGGTRYWCRPGKTRRDGISASSGRAGDRDRLWVFTDATELPQNEPITKFHAYAVLEFGGSHTAAARELRRQGFGANRREVAA